MSRNRARVWQNPLFRFATGTSTRHHHCHNHCQSPFPTTLPLTPVWPSTVRLEAGGATHVHLRTGASWSGRFEADICTIIRQVTTATEE